MGRQFGFNPSSWFNNFYYRQEGGNNVYTLTNPDLGNMLSVFNGGYSEANMIFLVQIMPELMFVCNAVASRVKSGVYSLVDKEGNEVENNLLWNKIINDGPNWQFTFEEFIWHAVMHKEATGNRYGYAYAPSTKVLKHANILSLWLVPPHYMQIIMKLPRPSYLVTTSASDYIDHYHYTGGDTMSNIPTEYITHDIYMKLGDSTDIVTGKGVSPYKAGEYPLSNLTAVYKARNVIYVKRGPLGAIVSAATDAGGAVALTPDEKKEALDDIFNRHGLNGGSQSPLAFTNQPIDYKKFGSTIQELEPFKETEASCAALCGIRGIPVSLMPKGADAKFANLDIAERNLYENVIFDEANAICKFLTKLGRFDELGLKVTVSFSHVTCLQDDRAKLAQAFKANVDAVTVLYDGGHITQNELRDNIELDPIEGGDEFKEDAETTDEDLPPQEDITVVPGEKPVKAKRIAPVLFGKKQKRKNLNCFNNGTAT